ncbi:MAG: glycosyl hydrolase, partial [Chthoniobacterales bacterium]
MKHILHSILVAALALSVAQAAPIRIVKCDENVPSKKRGICMNNMSAADFRALAPGVTWFYNWHFKSDSLPPAGVKMTFIPMVWGNRADALAALPAILAGANPKPPVVFAINEPNLKGQAFIPPKVTAEVFKKVAAIAAPFNVPVVGPHMAIGSGADSSIKAMDPLTNKVETYTFMVPFLKAFFHYMGATKVAAIGVHSYGNIGELKWSAGAVA